MIIFGAQQSINLFEVYLTSTRNCEMRLALG